MLSDEQIYECERIASIRYWRHTNSIRGQQLTSADDPQWHFARAVESEVRKKDTELIRQLVESLEGYRRNHNDTQPCDAERAGRAWLEGKP